MTMVQRPAHITDDKLRSRVAQYEERIKSIAERIELAALNGERLTLLSLYDDIHDLAKRLDKAVCWLETGEWESDLWESE